MPSCGRTSRTLEPLAGGRRGRGRHLLARGSSGRRGTARSRARVRQVCRRAGKNGKAPNLRCSPRRSRRDWIFHANGSCCMATRKAPPGRDKRRQKEIADEFRRHQVEPDPLPAPDVHQARRRKYQPSRLPPRLLDGQYVELPDDPSNEMLSEPPPFRVKPGSPPSGCSKPWSTCRRGKAWSRERYPSVRSVCGSRSTCMRGPQTA